MRNRLVLVALATLSLLFAGLALAQTRLVVGNISEAVNLDPRLISDTYSFQRIYTIFEPLVSFDKDLSHMPRLATEWSFSEDGSVITFKLREGVKWHHGTEFTSADVKYTIDWLQNPENPAATPSLWASIAEVTTPDPYTVVFRLDPVNVWAFNVLARTAIVPADRGDDPDFASNPSGTGPWQLVEWVRDDRMVLERFEDHWETERGNVDELVFRTIGEDASRLLAFEAGEIDLYQGQVVPVEVPRLEAETNWVSRVAGLGHTYLGMNLRNPILNDVRVRQAFYHLIPSQAIVQRLYNNVGSVGVSPVSPESVFFSPTTPRYPYDPERARELLAEAGYADGFDMTVLTFTGDEYRTAGQVLQQMFSEVGVRMTLDAQERGSLVEQIFKPIDENPTQAALVGASASTGDADLALTVSFTAASFPPASNNWSFFSDERVEELVVAGRTTGDPAEREAAYAEAQGIIWQDAPWVFLYSPNTIAGRSLTVTGVVNSPDNTIDARRAAFR